MNERELWEKRHEVKTELRKSLTSKQMNLVEDLLTVELLIERNEQKQKWFWQR